MLHLLVADTPIKEVVEIAGDYAEIFTKLFRNAGYNMGITVWDIVHSQDYPRIEDLTPVDTILVTGSKYDGTANDLWILSLVEFVAAAAGNCRLLGICFGHEIIARALKGKVGLAPHWEVSACDVELTRVGAHLFGQPSIRIMQMHKCQVYSVPRGTESIGRSPLTAVQGFYRPGEILCLQGHPEYTEELMRILCEKRFDGDFKRDAVIRAGNQTDHDLIIHVLVEFINGDL